MSFNVLLLGPRRSGKTRFISLAACEKYIPSSRFYMPTVSCPVRKVIRINEHVTATLIEPITSRRHHLKKADAVIIFASEGESLDTNVIDAIASLMKTGSTIGVVDSKTGNINCTADAISLIASLIGTTAHLSTSMAVPRLPLSSSSTPSSLGDQQRPPSAAPSKTAAVTARRYEEEDDKNEEYVSLSNLIQSYGSSGDADS